MQVASLLNDHNEGNLVSEVVLSSGHTCQRFNSSQALLDDLDQNGFDILIIDLHFHGQNGESGADVLTAMRARLQASIPVLVLASRSTEDRIACAMTAGASDYIVKPIRRGELLTRLHVILKRFYPEQARAEFLQFGTYLFEPQSARITHAGVPIDVTQKEFELALLFFRNLGRPLSRAYIIEAVWPHDTGVPSRTMDTHVSRVRSKLGLRPENGFRLAPVYSYGYRLEQLSR